MPDGRYLLAAYNAARKYGLPPELICALCEVESSWIPWAQRHEAGYGWLVGFKAVPLAVLLEGTATINGLLDEKTLFRDAAARTWQADPKRLAKFGGVVIGDRATILTELLNQQTSVGLMQPMFSTMRERGYPGRFGEMFYPATNLEWGCRHLRWMVDHNNAYGLPDFRIKPADLAAAWNGGSREVVDGKYANQGYVDKVLAAMANYQIGG